MAAVLAVAAVLAATGCGEGVSSAVRDQSPQVVGEEPAAESTTSALAAELAPRLEVRRVADIDAETFTEWHRSRQPSVLLEPVDVTGREPGTRYVVDGQVVDGVVCVSRTWGITVDQDDQDDQDDRSTVAKGPSGCAGFAVDAGSLSAGDVTSGAVTSDGVEPRRYVGTFDGTTFALTEPPGPVTSDLEPGDPRDHPFFFWEGRRAECATPPGDFTMSSADLALFNTNIYPAQWRALPGFVGFRLATNRIDGSRISVSDMFEAMGVDPRTVGSFPIPPLAVLAFATNDPAELAQRKADARAVYGGAVCVVTASVLAEDIEAGVAQLREALDSEEARRVGAGGVGEQRPDRLGDSDDARFDGFGYEIDVLVADDVTRQFLAARTGAATAIAMNGVFRPVI